MPYLYCIQCGHMDEVYQGSHRVMVEHLGYDFWGNWLEWKECSGPFTFEPMPVMDDDVDNLPEPDANELAMMDENASLLLADLNF